MKRIILVSATLASHVIAAAFVLTKVEQRRLLSRDRFSKELGYSLPDD